MPERKYQICTRCVMDTTDPDIKKAVSCEYFHIKRLGYPYNDFYDNAVRDYTRYERKVSRRVL